MRDKSATHDLEIARIAASPEVNARLGDLEGTCASAPSVTTCSAQPTAS